MIVFGVKENVPRTQTKAHIGDACVGDVFEGIFTAWPRKGTKFEVFKGRHEEDAKGRGA